MNTFAYALALTCLALPGFAANADPVDEKFLIPVPTEQRKIETGASKAYDDGSFEVTVHASERTQVELSIDGSEVVSFGNSTETLIENGDRICTVVFLGLVGKRAIISARCDPKSDDLVAALAAQKNAVPVEVIDPINLIAAAEVGSLTNPFLGQPDAIAEGRELFLANSCNGCHGGTGGGGMGPPLSNGVWVYGIDDDTLFRLVTLGSETLQEEGYSRVAREKVVGPMPPYEGIIENSDDLWKILAWVRSISPSDAPPLVE